MSRRPAPVTDLARERRIRRIVGEVGDLMNADPGLAERTRAMLRGDLDAPDLNPREAPMAETKQPRNVRLPPELLARVDAYAQRLQRENPGVRVTQGAAIRQLLTLALDADDATRKRRSRRSGQ